MNLHDHPIAKSDPRLFAWLKGIAERVVTNGSAMLAQELAQYSNEDRIPLHLRRWAESGFAGAVPQTVGEIRRLMKVQELESVFNMFNALCALYASGYAVIESCSPFCEPTDERG